ncbi:DUF726-domain-containing protein [Jackrogersella minutella]|nr:DUF726-domain-containing protein [Jackrogersella minutella]
MGRNNNNRGRAIKQYEADLTAVLAPNQKVQYTELISNIADGMVKQARSNLENITPSYVADGQGINPPRAKCLIIPNPRSDKYRHWYDPNAPPPQISETQNDDVDSIHQPERPVETPDHLWNIPNSPEELQVLYQKTDTEVLVQSMSDLKEDTSNYIKKWQGMVEKRLRDIVVKNGGFKPNGGNRQGDVLTPYNSASTPLRECSREQRGLILHATMLILLGMDQYSLHSRILLVRVASSLDIPMSFLLQEEVRVSKALSKIILGIPAEEIAQRRAEEAKTSRRWRPGMVIAASSGSTTTLSAPLAEAKIGTVFGGNGLSPAAAAGLLGGMNESTVAVGTLFGLYGARQGSKTIESHRKEVSDFAMMPIHRADKSELADPKDVPADDRRMRVTIGIAGLFTGQDDFTDTWKVLGPQNESYVMKWEVDALKKMGTSLETTMQTFTWHEAKKEISSVTAFDRLRQAFWPVGMVKLSKVIENPWCIGMVRAEKAGAVLADVLMNRLYGERPVTLIGYGLGARVIYACLMVLAEKRAFGVIENVVVMGAPCPSEVRIWAAIRAIVAGRIVNIYSKNDYMLAFLYRSSNWLYGVAGLQSIEGVPNIQNLDISEVVTNHLQYGYLVGSVLKRINWEDIIDSEVALQQNKLSQLMRLEKALEEQREARKE